LSSGDKVRTEGSNVTLECTARGSPKPKITWRRQDGNNIIIDKARNFSREYKILKIVIALVETFSKTNVNLHLR
jgi:hypothetical protein